MKLQSVKPTIHTTSPQPSIFNKQWNNQPNVVIGTKGEDFAEDWLWQQKWVKYVFKASHKRPVLIDFIVQCKDETEIYVEVKTKEKGSYPVNGILTTGIDKSKYLRYKEEQKKYNRKILLLFPTKGTENVMYYDYLDNMDQPTTINGQSFPNETACSRSGIILFPIEKMNKVNIPLNIGLMS